MREPRTVDERPASAAPERAPASEQRPPRRAAPPARKPRRRSLGVVTDPIADMLTRLRNATRARHETAAVPTSKLKVEVAKILKAEGFIAGYEGERGTLTIRLKYVGEGRIPAITDVQRVSRPGRRVYAGRSDLPRVRAGLGVTIVSTSQGLMSGREAARRGLGGEVLCAAW